MRTISTRSRTGACALLAACFVVGCGTVKVSDTARTATEQLLLTNAWDDALRKVDFRPLAGVPVFLDAQYANSPIDQGWMVSSIRQAMLAQGVLLRPKAEQAQWIVEPRVGVYGTNGSNLLFGVPQTTLPAVPGLTTAATIPEIPLAKRNKQQGVVKLALFAYDRTSGQVMWTSGTLLATSSAKDVYLGPVGPIQSGSIRERTEIGGMALPALIDGKSTASDSGFATHSGMHYQAPPLSIPASSADRDSFAP